MVSEFVTGVLAVLGLLAALIFGINYLDGVSCTDKWADSGYQTKHSFTSGCRVSFDGERWVPAKNVRE